MTNKDKIIKIALKYTGQKRIDKLIEFKMMLVDQQELLNKQYASVNNIIKCEQAGLRAKQIQEGLKKKWN